MKKQLALSIFLSALLIASVASAAEPIQFSGVYPHLAATTNSYSECGIGAVVPWADRLWYISYVAHKSGSGAGLYEIAPDLSIHRRPESVVGTHAGRMIHRESNQLIIGPYAIDAQGNVRVFRGLVEERVTAVMRHLTEPAAKIYVQAMEGNFYEANVETLESRLLFDLRKELDIRGPAHFKGGYTSQGRVVVANNSYEANDQQQGHGQGRLAQWNGQTWTVLERTAFCEVTTARGIEAVPDNAGPLFATGWDRRSVILCMLADGVWTTWRLPKASQSYDHAWCTEWPRIRQVDPQHLMLDMHGLYYLLSPDFGPARTASLTPWASHLKMTPDFCVWQDRLVLAGDECSSMGHRHRTGGQPQSNLWFGSLEELRQWGPRTGWGGPWLDDPVRAGVPSDPFFIQGFAGRTLHLWLCRTAKAATAAKVRFTLQIDRDGSGAWTDYQTFEVPSGGYVGHVIPDDVPGVWLRIVADENATASAQFCFATAAADEPAKADRFAAFSPAATACPRVHGALMPFADRLWCSAYTSDPTGRAQQGLGLWEIASDASFTRRPESLPGIFANRKMLAKLLSVGPHLIDDAGQVRTFEGLRDRHVVSTIRHPQPDRIYFLTVEGELLEGDIPTLAIRSVADIPKALGLAEDHLRFKAGHLADKTVLVAAATDDGQSGCLAEFDGQKWLLVDRSPMAEISNLGSMSEQVLATGWDRASALIKIRTGPGTWETCRLPKADEAMDRAWGDQWPRIREVVTERVLVDLAGIVYEVSGLPYAWSVRPVASHGRMFSDYCSWRGLLVLAGSDRGATAPNVVAGPEGAQLWFGTVDDLWSLGRPRGNGGPWQDTPVEAAHPSDPYLMCGFTTKQLELSHNADHPVRFALEIAPTVRRDLWLPYAQVEVSPGQVLVREFPSGFSAHWIRLSAEQACRATARLIDR